MIGKIREGMNGQQVANLLDDNFKYLDNKVDVGIQEITEDVTNFKDNVNNTLDTQLTKYEEAIDKLVDDSIIAADEEDITSDKGFAKFADRAYDPDKFSGKGYKILRKKMYKGKNTLFQEDINEPNTIYEIRYDFDLNGQEITIPEECVLKFEGGTLSNGKVNYNDCKIIDIVNINTYGLFNNKPTEEQGISVGFAYFCTDKQTSEGSTNGIMIYHKGNNIWVDALGRIVE